jgi:hypothetical protein
LKLSRVSKVFQSSASADQLFRADEPGPAKKQVLTRSYRKPFPPPPLSCNPSSNILLLISAKVFGSCIAQNACSSIVGFSCPETMPSCHSVMGTHFSPGQDSASLPPNIGLEDQGLIRDDSRLDVNMRPIFQKRRRLPSSTGKKAQM